MVFDVVLNVNTVPLTVELRVNNQETILEMKTLQVEGVRWENIEILNHGDEVVVLEPAFDMYYYCFYYNSNH
jgi:hypothetical protein